MPKTSCILDNLILYVDEVYVGTYQRLVDELNELEMQGKVPEVRITFGKGYSEYHYRINIGQGAGAITIGYKHNSSRENQEFYRMRLEFNPAKSNKLHENFWDLFVNVFSEHKKTIKQLDLAFDVPVDIGNVLAVSLTGKQRAYYKNTKYFGSRGNNGRLKIYDKKAELEENQGVTIVEESRTRIEYTWRFEEPLTIQLFSKVAPGINNDYKIVYFDEEKLDGAVKASVLAVHNEQMEMKEFSRTMKTKIKNALANMEKLDLDHVYQSEQDAIFKLIRTFLNRL